MSQALDGSDPAGLTEAELDRLADFLADVLDQVDAAEVDRLIADELRWALAHRALVAADATVRTDLAGLATAESTMPADVAARLDEALRGFTRDGGQVTGLGSGTVVSLAAARARRRRLHRVAAVAAAVVAVVGGVGAGLSVLSDRLSSTAIPAMGQAESTDSGPTAPLTAAGGPVLMASQRDYTLNTLAQIPAAVPELAVQPNRGGEASPTSQSVTKGSDYGMPSSVRDAAPDELARLLPAHALAQCLDAIRGTFPGVVLSVDYARFDQQPALVVLVQRAGGRTAVAVGPDCGASGTDQLASVPVR